MNRVAIIDIGSNSLKLVIADIYDNRFFQIIYEKKIKLRLSDYKNENNEITAIGAKKLASHLGNIKKLCKESKCNRIIAVATETLRKSKNGDEIIEFIKDLLNIDIKIISGEEEAYYGFVSSINSNNLRDFLQIDIGGSSCEIVLVNDKKLVNSVSIPYGSIPNTNNFNLLNRVLPEDEERFKNIIIEELNKYDWIKKGKNLPIIGIGGSVRCIKKILKNHVFDNIDFTENTTISYDIVNNLFNNMKKLNLEQKKEIKGMPVARADIFVGCIILIKYIMSYINSDQLYISKFGIREGILFEYAENLYK